MKQSCILNTVIIKTVVLAMIIPKSLILNIWSRVELILEGYDLLTLTVYHNFSLFTPKLVRIIVINEVAN